MKLGERLRLIRNQHKMTQQNVADILGIDRTTYTFYETGTTSPSLKTLYKLSQIYNVTVGYVMGVEENRPELIRHTEAQAVPVHDVNLLADVLSKDEYKIIASFRTFDEKSKKQVVDFIDEIAKQHRADKLDVSDKL